MRAERKRLEAYYRREETGETVVSLCREAGISRKTYYKWKKRPPVRETVPSGDWERWLEDIALKQPELTVGQLVKVLKETCGMEKSRSTASRSLAKKGLGTLRGRMEAFLRKAASGGASVGNLSQEGLRACVKFFPEAGLFPWVEKGCGVTWTSGRIALARLCPGEKSPFTYFDVCIAVELFSGFVAAKIYSVRKSEPDPYKHLAENLLRLWFSSACEEDHPSEGGLKPNFVKGSPCRLVVRRFGRLLRTEFERIFETMSWQFNYKEAALHLEHWIRSYNRAHREPGYPNFGKTPWERISGKSEMPRGERRIYPEVEHKNLFDVEANFVGVEKETIEERKDRRYFVRASLPSGWGNEVDLKEPRLFKKPYVVRIVISPCHSEESIDLIRCSFKDFLERPEEFPLRRFHILKTDGSDPKPLAEVLFERNELYDILEMDLERMGDLIGTATSAIFHYFEGHDPTREWVEWANRESIRIEPIGKVEYGNELGSPKGRIDPGQRGAINEPEEARR